MHLGSRLLGRSSISAPIALDKGGVPRHRVGPTPLGMLRSSPNGGRDAAGNTRLSLLGELLVEKVPDDL